MYVYLNTVQVSASTGFILHTGNIKQKAAPLHTVRDIMSGDVKSFQGSPPTWINQYKRGTPGPTHRPAGKILPVVISGVAKINNHYFTFIFFVFPLSCFKGTVA
jgi:hypothetical protein